MWKRLLDLPATIADFTVGAVIVMVLLSTAGARGMTAAGSVLPTPNRRVA